MQETGSTSQKPKADNNLGKGTSLRRIHYQQDRERLHDKYGSAMRYVLSGLIPYTEANIKLSFKPSMFFDDLAKLDSAKNQRVQKNSLRTAYYRAIARGLAEVDPEGIPRLTEKGRLKTKLYKPKKLGKNARLLLVFDIPEINRHKRTRLRALLRELSFRQIQQSVWECEYDYREYIKSEIKDSGLEGNVVVFEALKAKL